MCKKSTIFIFDNTPGSSGSHPASKEDETEKTFPGKPYRRRTLFTIVVAAVFAQAAASAMAAGALIDINSSDQKTLEPLTGVGAKKAQAIIDARPYRKPEDITKVKGIEQGIYYKIRDRITVQ